MQLTVNGDVCEDPASTDLIVETIASMANDDDFFLILAKDEITYIQTSGCKDAGFVLEYQDGSIEQHYSCTNAPLSTDQIVTALQRYLTSDGRWKSDFTWEKQDLGPTPVPKKVGARTAMLVLGITVIAISLWWYSAGA